MSERAHGCDLQPSTMVPSLLVVSVCVFEEVAAAESMQHTCLGRPVTSLSPSLLTEQV